MTETTTIDAVPAELVPRVAAFYKRLAELRGARQSLVLGVSWQPEQAQVELGKVETQLAETEVVLDELLELFEDLIETGS